MSDRELVRTAHQDFLSTDLDGLLRRQADGGAERHLVGHLQRMAREVPAYRGALARAGVDAGSIRGAGDLARLPILSKDSYHRAHGLAELCWSGSLADLDMIAVSSGSTGEPAVWPRHLGHEVDSASRFEQVFHDSFRAHQRTTLAVVCFALGTWVGGMYTAGCVRLLAAKGYRITVATPGNQLPEILRVLRQLAPAFDQVVLMGYPPFLKDVVDAAPHQGFAWPLGRVRLVTAGECFSEAWRDLVCSRVGAANPELDTASLYGTADGGVLASETPVSIRIRRLLDADAAARRAIFASERMPTLCQYDPATRWFEADDGQLLFTADGGIPLARYRILDHGGIETFAGMLARLRAHGIEPLAGLGAGTPVRELPFVWVFGRTHVALSLDGANIFPEHIAGALERPPLSDACTGKFVMRIEADADHNPRLACVLELLPGVESDPGLPVACALAIQAQLERVNSEYAHYVPASRRRPVVAVRPHRDAEWFPAGTKHRYVR